MNLLKNVGKGVLYIIGLPFFLIVLAGTAVAGIVIIVFMFIKSILLFFTGRSLNDDLPEDRKAREIKEGRTQGAVYTSQPYVNQPAPQVNTNPQPVIQPQQPVQQQPVEAVTIEEAVFGPSTPVQEEPEEEPVIVEEPVEQEPVKPVIEETIIESAPIQNNPRPVEKEITIGEYRPKTGGSRVIEDFEDDEETDGVTITFGDDDE